MDIVLGVSVTPASVQMVLLEGENAGGVTVDQDVFDVDADQHAPDRVVSAIVGTREGAQEGGYHLTSIGVTAGDQQQVRAVRQALADHKIGHVTVVSSFLAAAALTQTVGAALGYQQTALLLVEPDTAALAVVDTEDGSITDVERHPLPEDDAAAVAELQSLVAHAGELPSSPDGVFAVGSGVDVGMIKTELESTGHLPVSVPEEPVTALARGAALASAHTPLLDSSTAALAWARDPGTGFIDPELVAMWYADVSDPGRDPSATMSFDDHPLAYSAVDDEDEPDYPTVLDAPGSADDYADDYAGDYPGDYAGDYSGDYADTLGRADSADYADYGDSAGYAVEPAPAEAPTARKPFLMAGSAMAAFFVAAVSSLVVVLAVGIRPTAATQPSPLPNVIVPTERAPAPEVKPSVPKQSVPNQEAPKGDVPIQVPQTAAPVPEAPQPVVPDVVPTQAPATVAPVPIPVPVEVPEQVPEVQPSETVPKATAPRETEPESPPKTTVPKATQPKATEPESPPKTTVPKATEPKATEPKATEPKATAPKATEPKSQPKVTEPKSEPSAPKQTPARNPFNPFQRQPESNGGEQRQPSLFPGFPGSSGRSSEPGFSGFPGSGGSHHSLFPGIGGSEGGHSGFGIFPRIGR